MEIDNLSVEKSLEIKKGDALIVVDVQNDFLPGGALAVENGDEIIPGVNQLIEKFYSKDYPVILTQDWHPPDHASFASVHPGKNPLDPIEGPGIGPVLWPDHCVQESTGANFHPDLTTNRTHLTIRKGYHKNIDSYSTFLENDKKTKTGLDGYLNSLTIKRVFICGLALDYCVFYSAVDAKSLGFEVVNVVDLTRAVGSPEGIISTALETMVDKQVSFINHENIT
ncbi:MAG: bifunctional nicotinamidase/pyrazinamidase [Candidatus Hodarchaeales archaeon]|jgi:nicotinamidase/pyrazinamidase